MPPQMRTPAASDAEIRAYLLPRIRAGRPPTYEAMRAALGGGYSRLARLKKQVEAEISGRSTSSNRWGPVEADAMVKRLEGLFAQQLRALEQWGREQVTSLKAERLRSRRAASHGRASAGSLDSAIDRLERRLVSLQGPLEALVSGLAKDSASTVRTGGGGAWSPQAEVAGVAGLDSRLESLEKSVRALVTKDRAASDAAAGVARQIAGPSESAHQGTSQSQPDLQSDQQSQTQPAAPWSGEVLAELRHHRRVTIDAARHASAVRDRCAMALSSALITFADLHLAQIELQETTHAMIQSGAIHRRSRSAYQRR